jgi:hypothetical protein
MLAAEGMVARTAGSDLQIEVERTDRVPTRRCRCPLLVGVVTPASEHGKYFAPQRLVGHGLVQRKQAVLHEYRRRVLARFCKQLAKHLLLWTAAKSLSARPPYRAHESKLASVAQQNCGKVQGHSRRCALV